jgi:hypothetical protein
MHSGQRKSPIFRNWKRTTGLYDEQQRDWFRGPDAMDFGQIVNEQAGNDSAAFDVRSSLSVAPATSILVHAPPA